MADSIDGEKTLAASFDLPRLELWILLVVLEGPDAEDLAVATLYPHTVGVCRDPIKQSPR